MKQENCIKRLTIGICIIFFYLNLVSTTFAQDEFADDAADEFVEGAEGEVNAEAAPAAAQSLGDSFFRFAIATEMMAIRFNTPHPFKQLAGSDAFDDPTAYPSVGFFFGNRIPGQKDYGTLQPILHNMPAFSIEYLMPTDLFFIEGASLEYYHAETTHLDSTVAAQAASGPKSKIPLIKMQTYYDLFSLLAHVFNPADAGPNAFFGIGLGSIEGSYEGGFRGRLENNFTRTTSTKGFNSTNFFRVVGVDASGDTFGLRFALYLFNRAAVITDNVFRGNPLAPKAKSTIYFDGNIIRAAMTWRF